MQVSCALTVIDAGTIINRKAEPDCIFVEYPDYEINEYGSRGMGETGLAGAAPGPRMAVYHATGEGVRKLPVGVEDPLAAPQNPSA